MRKYHIEVTRTQTNRVEVIADTEEQAKELAKAIPTRTEPTITATITNSEELIPIMNESNNHDAELVDKINKAYHTNRRDFETIVALLALRDKDECQECEVNNDIHLYLMRVADDKDLECILNFVRTEG